MKWHVPWHHRSEAMPWVTWAIFWPIEFATAQSDHDILREDKQIWLIEYMYMHIIRTKHPSISSFLWSITQKWDSTDLFWAKSLRSICPHCRPAETSPHQLLVPPYSCSSLWTLWKVSGVKFTSGTKYTWESKIPIFAETSSHLFWWSPIINDESWTSFMPRFILTWLHRLHQGNATGRRCLWHSISPAIWCLSPKKSPVTCEQPSGRNTYHLLVTPAIIVEECYLWPMMRMPQHITLHIVNTSISWPDMQIRWFSPTANLAKWCNFELK